jgi:Fe-S cluster biogenesis protein NfuA|tara:strand:- start:10197 stop:10484 length:288 start_codon:yes stop_codon:yes gene_type:complete
MSDELTGIDLVKDQINEIIDNTINPSLSMHGGSLSLEDIELCGDSWCVYVRFHGGCNGCPSATSQTLSMVEMCLREEMDASGLMVRNIDSHRVYT